MSRLAFLKPKTRIFSAFKNKIRVLRASSYVVECAVVCMEECVIKIRFVLLAGYTCGGDKTTCDVTKYVGNGECRSVLLDLPATTIRLCIQLYPYEQRDQICWQRWVLGLSWWLHLWRWYVIWLHCMTVRELWPDMLTMSTMTSVRFALLEYWIHDGDNTTLPPD